MLVPKLRFREFKEEWNKYKLNNIVTRIIRKNKNNESNLPLTISAQYGLVDQITFFNKNVSSSDLSNYYLLYNGEFAYNKSYSNGYPWGTVKKLKLYDKGVLSSLYICFSINQNMNSDFLEHYFESTKWYYQISQIAVEGARNHGLLNIAVDDFFNTKHYFPNIKEQEKIANFLNLLDKKIELQQRKIEALKIYKKGLIQELFGFNTFYEKKLEDICNITTGKLDANAMTLNGEYRFYTCAKEYYRINIYAFDTEALLISGNGAYVGYIHYYKGKFNAYQRTYVLDKFSENILYIKYYLDTFLAKRILAERKEGNTPYIVLNTLAKMPIIFPSSKVQNQIVSTLIKFDTKLDLENKKLDKLHIIKKSLLQQMFI